MAIGEGGFSLNPISGPAIGFSSGDDLGGRDDSSRRVVPALMAGEDLGLQGWRGW